MTQTPKESDARILVDDLLRRAGWDPADKSQVQTETPVKVPAHVLGVTSRSQARPFDCHAPVYDLKAAAGPWGADRAVGLEGDEVGWLDVPPHVRLSRDHFIAQVVGQSMEPRIPDGSYCLFRLNPAGSRQGKLARVDSWTWRQEELSSSTR